MDRETLNLVIGFLVFGVISCSVLIILSNVFNLCYKYLQKRSESINKEKNELKNKDDKNGLNELNETKQKSDINNMNEWNDKMEKLQNKILGLETKLETNTTNSTNSKQRSKSHDLQQYIIDNQYKDEYKYESPILLKRRHSVLNTSIKRRFSGIANYYKKYRNCPIQINDDKDDDDDDDGDDGSISPMSTIYYPNRTRLSVSPKSYSRIEHSEHSEHDVSDIKLYETPKKYKHIRRNRHLSGKTTIFEDIMMSSTVLDGIRIGKLHDVIHQCAADDIAHFFPIIAAIICKVPYGMKVEQDRLLQSIRKRALENPCLRQTIQFFMISNQNNELVRQIWRHNAFMIALDSSRHINISIDDHDVIPSTHTKLKRKKSSGLITHHLQYNNNNDNNNDTQTTKTNDICIKRRGSFTTDDVNIQEINLQKLLLLSPEQEDDDDDDDEDEDDDVVEIHDGNNEHRRRFTRSYIEQFNDNVEIFRWMLNSPVGSEFKADIKSEIFDPIHDNQQIYRMEVKKIFQSAARPVLVETFDKNNQSIGSIIIKEGDDLRADENMMFMFHIMNAIWEEHQCSFNQHPIRALTYLCVAMGNDFGCIELVENCVPLRNISTLADKFENDEQLLNNLIASTVGSYIATYIMGVGDRHFDNILIRDDGTLFHIDFGYILGQKVSIDTSEFAITTDLYNIIIGQDEELWQQFIDICCDAFMILRKHIDELIQFASITFTFLNAPTSIDQFFHEIFGTDLMDKEVEILLRSKLEQAPFDWNTRIKNTMHSWATASWYPRNIDLSVIRQLSLVSNQMLSEEHN